MPSDRAALIELWQARFAEPVVGWSFDAFGDDLLAEEPPWSYPAIARRVLRGAGSALDIGTGGGEILLGLADALPPDTVATEGWEPNVPVAQRALAALDIEVIAYDAEDGLPMPFDDGRFDVVLNRHEGYDVAEVARVLAPGGAFVTQQVDGRDFEEKFELFGTPMTYAHVTLDEFAADARRCGLEVDEAADWNGRLRFADVATLVSYLRMVPWDLPDDFTIDRYADTLLDLHDAEHPLAFTQRRFYLVARKPAFSPTSGALEGTKTR